MSCLKWDAPQGITIWPRLRRRWSNRPERVLMSRQLWLIDRMFALPSIAHTVVNPGFFADSPYMEMMPFAAHLGVFPLPVAGESRNAPPSVDDIARVAVAALLDPARHAGKSYRPTGAEIAHRHRNGRAHRPCRRPQRAACEDAALDVLQGSQGARQGAYSAQRPEALLPRP
jgi:hypothetical protein